MRLGIRRKLIGTLILVGLFPLVMSLVVILGGGAAIQLNRIRGSYEDTAANCAEHISDTLLHEEFEKLALISRLPPIVDYVRSQNVAPLPAPGAGGVGGVPIPQASPADIALDKQWPGLKPGDPALDHILNNELSDRLKLLSQVDGHRRQTTVTNAAGQLIAADSKTDDFFQADETWWQTAFNNGHGRLHISTLTNATDPSMAPGEQIVEIALPIYADVEGRHLLVGILKDDLAVSWLLRTLHDVPESKGLHALTQLIDIDSRKTMYVTGGDGDLAGPGAVRAESFYFQHRAELDGGGPSRPHALSLLYHDLVIGTAPVELETKLPTDRPFATREQAHVPHWVIVVSQPAGIAMTPVYRLAGIVAGIGIALILVLFILGVAISNREIIMPILRLREATAAVGRGELNVRLLAGNERDATFRRDELGDLARDFDEMTRQLQKNVNQLARSNEAKRRFMELAGHELRTPVTYLLGVCQLAQKQLQSLSAAATDGVPEDERTVALAAKNAASVTGALTKIAAKTQRLSRIIDNLLKLVNNDQFTTRMNKQPVDIRALILQVTADHRPFIAERKQQLLVEVSENLPSIEADRDKLEDALTNLVSNAIRFSPDGGAVRVAAHEVVGDMLEILVEDSGPGIPAEDLANLFEPFYTGSDILHHHSGTFEFGSKGLGLGLAIVRRFIELHGGIVRAHTVVKDNKTTGTQFQILLPLTKTDPGDSGITPAQQAK